MTIICAWCGEFQQEKAPMNDKRVSHTICGKCRERVLGQSERHLMEAAEVTAAEMAGDDFFAQACNITREHATKILQEKGDRV